MQAQELLMAIAQIAVALAGFSGLIAAIRTAAPEGWHPRDVWSLSWMLGASIGALLFALLPAWLALFGREEAGVFRIASALLCAFTASFVGVMANSGRRLTRSGYPPRVKGFPALLVIVLSVAALTTGAAAFGAFPDSLVAVYVGALLALLFASALVLAIFLVLLARTARRD